MDEGQRLERAANMVISFNNIIHILSSNYSLTIVQTSKLAT